MRTAIESLMACAALFCSMALSRAEVPPPIQWQRSFGGQTNEYLASIQQTSDGGFILGGDSYSAASGNKTSSNFGGSDCWVVKVDSNGNKQWEKSFGGYGEDYCYSL